MVNVRILPLEAVPVIDTFCPAVSVEKVLAVQLVALILTDIASGFELFAGASFTFLQEKNRMRANSATKRGRIDFFINSII